MTIAPGGLATQPLVEGIVADLQMGLGELKCVGSERMVKQGVSMTHLHVMFLLDHHGELSMSRVAELLDVSDSNATGLVDRLEERGLVERVRDREDRRVVMVRLAAAGVQVITDQQLLRDDFIQRVLAQLNESQLEGLATAIADVRHAAEQLFASDPTITDHWHAHRHASTTTPARA
jgi:DNA-binding MarR family transcriptional regulator